MEVLEDAELISLPFFSYAEKIMTRIDAKAIMLMTQLHVNRT